MRSVSSLLILVWGLVGCGGAGATAPTTPEREGEPQAVWEDPDHDPYNFYRSVTQTLLRTQQYGQALKTTHRMRKLRPRSPEPQVLRARAEMGLQQFAIAERTLARALELAPEDAAAHALMGELLNARGKHREADEHHRRAIALSPENVSYQNNLAFGLYLQKRYREAIAAYRAALEQDASAKRVHNNLGFAYAGAGDMERAYQHFKLAGVPAQAHNNTGFAYEQRGELERAYDHYLAALESDPRLIQARRNLERVCAELGREVPNVPVPPAPAPPALPPVEASPGAVDAAEAADAAATADPVERPPSIMSANDAPAVDDDMEGE